MRTAAPSPGDGLASDIDNAVCRVLNDVAEEARLSMAWSGASIILRRFPVDCGATMIIAIQCSLAALCFGLCVGVLDQPRSIWTAGSYMAL